MMMAAAGARHAHAWAQRDRILDAAQQCFAERGFHGASMAMIADTARISAGLIYRYFAGKSELIQGIVHRQMEWLEGEMKRMESTGGDAVCRIIESFRDGDCRTGADDQPVRRIEPALVLEIIAESGRDPVIAKAMASFDARIDDILESWLARPRAQGGFGVPAGQLRVRTVVLRALLDGLKMRQTREGEALDIDLLSAALQEALPGLMGTD
ncbi:TetR/AcrR family transcriptional regulator [Solilutibacter pythonis]|nr:TetR/AcrR family transcriptional regulator [Lysobacter pythonis]